MKHILRLVTYGALTPSKWEHGRPSRARDPQDELAVVADTASVPVGTKYGDLDAAAPFVLSCDLFFGFRLVGVARYPDRVESRYERYL